MSVSASVSVTWESLLLVLLEAAGERVAVDAAVSVTTLRCLIVDYDLDGWVF